MLGFVFISVIFVFRGLRITASLRTGPNIILNFSTAPQGLAIIFWPSAKTFLQFVGEGAVRLRIVNSKLQLKHKQDCRSGLSFLTSQLLNFLCFIVIEMESERRLPSCLTELLVRLYCGPQTSFTFPYICISSHAEIQLHLGAPSCLHSSSVLGSMFLRPGGYSQPAPPEMISCPDVI